MLPSNTPFNKHLTPRPRRYVPGTTLEKELKSGHYQEPFIKNEPNIFKLVKRPLPTSYLDQLKAASTENQNVDETVKFDKQLNKNRSIYFNLPKAQFVPKCETINETSESSNVDISLNTRVQVLDVFDDKKIEKENPIFNNLPEVVIIEKSQFVAKCKTINEVAKSSDVDIFSDVVVQPIDVNFDEQLENENLCTHKNNLEVSLTESSQFKLMAKENLIFNNFLKVANSRKRQFVAECKTIKVAKSSNVAAQTVDVKFDEQLKNENLGIHKNNLKVSSTESGQFKLMEKENLIFNNLPEFVNNIKKNPFVVEDQTINEVEKSSNVDKFSDVSVQTVNDKQLEKENPIFNNLPEVVIIEKSQFVAKCKTINKVAKSSNVAVQTVDIKFDEQLKNENLCIHKNNLEVSNTESGQFKLMEKENLIFNNLPEFVNIKKVDAECNTTNEAPTFSIVEKSDAAVQVFGVQYVSSYTETDFSLINERSCSHLIPLGNQSEDILVLTEDLTNLTVTKNCSIPKNVRELWKQEKRAKERERNRLRFMKALVKELQDIPKRNARNAVMAKLTPEFVAEMRAKETSKKYYRNLSTFTPSTSKQ